MGFLDWLLGGGILLALVMWWVSLFELIIS